MHNQVLGNLLLQFGIAEGNKTTDVNNGVLLGAHGTAIGIRAHLKHNIFHRHVRVFRIPDLDEPGIFRKAAGIQKEGDTETVINLGSPANIVHGNRLSGCRVIGDGEHSQGDILRANLLNKLFQFLQIHVALEGQLDGAVFRLRHCQIDRVCPQDQQVCLGGVKVAVIGYVLPLFDQRRKKHPFRCPSLVSGKHVLKAQNILNGFLEAVITLGASVRFIPAHHTGPLFVAHRVGAAVGQQIDVYVFGRNVKKIEMRLRQRCLPLCSGGHLHFFNYLDAKRLHEWNGHKLSFSCSDLN